MARQNPGEPYWRVGLDEANNMIGQGDAVVIDVRDSNEWAAGHVAGAIHIPVDDILSRVDELPSDKDLLFICAMGVRSGLACEMAAAMDISSDRLYNIEDGTNAWITSNYPTEKA